MLFDVIMIILVVYAVLSPVIVLQSVKFGIKTAQRPEKAAEEPVFHIPKPHKKPEIDHETQRKLDILDNINTYNGSSTGQKEID